MSGLKSKHFWILDDGNRLTAVAEAAADYDVAGSFEYKKAKGSEYIYNSNGSLVADKSRGIAYITYDVNNNPQNIYFTNGNETRYIYSASGEKLRVTHYVAMPNITRTFGVKPEGNTTSQIIFAGQKDYLLGGSLIMQEEKIDKVLFDGGYMAAERLNATTYGFTPYYYNQDHLGNNREVVNGSGTVQQVTNYYPSGAPYADPVAVVNASFQPYKYNGKELDLMHGLNTYDYGARQYNPILARWDRVDPLSEKYYGISPYAYCAGNPVNAIDLGGKEVFALNPLARRNICNTLTKEEMAYVRFLSNGMLDIDLLNKCNSSSNNFSSLRILGNSSTKYYFSVAEKDLDGIPFYEKGTNNDNPSNFRYGITHLPGAENSPSPNDNVYIYTASFLDEKTQARNTAHEAFGHALFYELSKEDSKYIPYHTYGVVDKAIEHDPVNGDYEYSIFGKTNKLLEEQIKVVEQEAIDNYERNH